MTEKSPLPPLFRRLQCSWNAGCISAKQSTSPPVKEPEASVAYQNNKENLMIILVNSKINSSNIQSSLGKPEYSYYFLLAQLIPAMEQFARVIELESPEEVDATYRKLSATGESVVFISASPPHLTPLDLQCPTVSLFAWEFPDAPDQPWDNNPCNDWRHPLKHLAGAIASSWESAQAVRNLDGHSCPVTSVPAAVWPHFGDLLPEGGWRPAATQRHFEFSGFVLDSHVLGLSANGLVQHAPRSPRYTRVNSAGKDKRGAIGQTLDIFRSWRAAIRNRKSKADAARSEEHTSELQSRPHLVCRLLLEKKKQKNKKK